MTVKTVSDATEELILKPAAGGYNGTMDGPFTSLYLVRHKDGPRVPGTSSVCPAILRVIKIETHSIVTPGSCDLLYQSQVVAMHYFFIRALA